MLVAVPLNLLDHVTITSGEQALEFVRLFSSADTYLLFPYVGMVEIEPAEKDGLYKLNKSTYLGLFREARVEQYPESGEPRGFFVTRTVLRPSGHVVEVTEHVARNGFYSIVSESVLYEDGWKLGLTFIGPN